MALSFPLEDLRIWSMEVRKILTQLHPGIWERGERMLSPEKGVERPRRKDNAWAKPCCLDSVTGTEKFQVEGPA